MKVVPEGYIYFLTIRHFAMALAGNTTVTDAINQSINQQINLQADHCFLFDEFV